LLWVQFLLLLVVLFGFGDVSPCNQFKVLVLLDHFHGHLVCGLVGSIQVIKDVGVVAAEVPLSHLPLPLSLLLFTQHWVLPPLRDELDVLLLVVVVVLVLTHDELLGTVRVVLSLDSQ
jgi:hypothetical protein